MPVRKTIPEKDGVYFITFTCAQWLPLFKISDSYDSVYNWFNYLKANGHFIVGYIIMPNHVHAIIAFRNTGKTINSIVGNGKRFMALFSAQCPSIAMRAAKALCGLRTKSLIVIRRFSNSIDFTNFPKSKPCL